MGLLVAGLADQAALVAAATEDRIHQPARTALFPEAPALLVALVDAGALAACWSGAGPTLVGFVSPDSVESVRAGAGPRSPPRGVRAGCCRCGPTGAASSTGTRRWSRSTVRVAADCAVDLVHRAAQLANGAVQVEVVAAPGRSSPGSVGPRPGSRDCWPASGRRCGRSARRARRRGEALPDREEVGVVVHMAAERAVRRLDAHHGARPTCTTPPSIGTRSNGRAPWRPRDRARSPSDPGDDPTRCPIPGSELHGGQCQRQGRQHPPEQADRLHGAGPRRRWSALGLP